MHEKRTNPASPDTGASSATAGEDGGKNGLIKNQPWRDMDEEAFAAEEEEMGKEEKEEKRRKEKKEKKKAAQAAAATKAPGDAKSGALVGDVRENMEEEAYDAAEEEEEAFKKEIKAKKMAAAARQAAEEEKRRTNTGGKQALLSLLYEDLGVNADEASRTAGTAATPATPAIPDPVSDADADPDTLTPAERDAKVRAERTLYRFDGGGLGFVEEQLDVQALIDEQEARRRGKGTAITAGTAGAAATKKQESSNGAAAPPAGRARDQLRRLQLLAATKQARTKNEFKQRRVLGRRPAPGSGGGGGGGEDSSDDEAVGRSGLGQRKKKSRTG